MGRLRASWSCSRAVLLATALDPIGSIDSESYALAVTVFLHTWTLSKKKIRTLFAGVHGGVFVFFLCVFRFGVSCLVVLFFVFGWSVSPYSV